ncbi:MAG TPA: ATP-binding protein, partial [Cytophagaceae bacterium]
DRLRILKPTASFDLNLSADHDRLEADPLHLTNILDNLIDNAIKYSPDGPLLNIRTFNTRGIVHISIQDSGIGIEREHHKKIFNNFYRIPTGNLQSVKGFGLGLHYVKLMTRAHKGDIKLVSQVGVGSEFIISFPYLI